MPVQNESGEESKSDSTTLCVQLSAGFDAPVSKYRITKVTLFTRPSLAVSMEANVEILLIYNPFHIDDPVFMGVDKERQEFVMEDSGMLFLRATPAPGGAPASPGSSASSSLRSWTACCCCCPAPSWPGRSGPTPVKVARALSAVINSIDEGGLLVGNWSGNYEDGRSPTEWTGSLKIFRGISHATSGLRSRSRHPDP
uniref:C2 domain-containing protein n=1 Tax=Macrostomum lignano TaxID=282301 RepID=A0A1I8F6G1_9PLAT